MNWLSMGGGLLLAIGAFVAGWLTATEKTRIEVYKKRLETYLEVNRLVAKLFHLSIKNSIDTNQFFGPMVEARLILTEYFVSNAIVVSKEVGKLVQKLTEAKKEPDLEEIRVTFNVLVQQMAKELKFDKIHSVNETLLQLMPTKKQI
jgi:hypothetical protein